MSLLCIYHNNCADGFGAAWVVRKRCLLDDIDVEFFGATHGQPSPDCKGKNVLIVDFCYKRDEMNKICNEARSVVVIDHHKTAQELIGQWPVVRPFEAWDAIDRPKGYVHNFDYSQWVDKIKYDDYIIATLFDMKKSGAGLVWDFFFPSNKRPDLINIIEDRDLHRFDFPNTREVQAAVFSYPYDFEVWDKLMEMPLTDLEQEGVAIDRKLFKDIEELVPLMVREIDFASEVKGLVVNVPYTMATDACMMLIDNYGAEIGASYYTTPNGLVFSLRSAEDGPDVSAIAKKFGGGGHMHAAGFTIPHVHARDLGNQLYLSQTGFSDV